MPILIHEPSEAIRRLRGFLRRNDSARCSSDARDEADAYLLPWSGRPQPAPSGSNPVPPPPPYITPEGRDLRIDLLRGFFVLAMIIDHVRGESPLYLLTGGNRFFVSAAEGFILMSGLMAGLVYRRVVARAGLAAAVRKVWARAVTLYLVTVCMTLLLLPISEMLGLPWAEGLDMTHSVDLVVSVLTLHRTYYLADVLLLYTVLFIVTPAAILLMADGKTKVLLGLSWLLWGLQQLVPDAAALPWPIAGNYLFTFSAWQLLFINGLVIGYQRDRIRSLTRRGAARLQRVTGAATLALIALYGLLQVPASALPRALSGFGAGWEKTQLWLQQYLFGKVDVRPGRVFAAAIVFTFLFLTLTRQWRVVRRLSGWLLAPLGKNSLYAFTAHGAVVAIVAMALLPLGWASTSPWWFNAPIQVASVMLIWLLVRRRLLEPTAKTRSAWRVSPAAVAVVALFILPLLPAHTSVASTAPVSEAVLNRARAYGTPVLSLDPAASLHALATVDTAKSDGASVATPISFETAAERTAPASTVAPRAAATTPPPPVAVAAIRPAATPLPPAPTAPVAAAQPKAALQPTATAAPLEPAPKKLINSLIPSTDPASQPAADPVSSKPVAQPAANAIAPKPVTQAAANAIAPKPVAQAAANAIAPKPVAQPAAKPVSFEPPPPLPPESERLVTQYIGPLKGSIYARTMHSDLLNRDFPYWIYLPPGYGRTSQRYPVLYMLHGGGGVLDEWAALGIFEAADAEIVSGALQPMIIVLPQGDKSYFTNWANDSPRWGDYMAYEVVGAVDSAFATIRDRSARAIGGLSMGAWGALYQAFTHPDIFGVVGAHSPSLYPDDNNLKFLGVGAEFASKDPGSLARTQPKLDTLRIWIDVGDKDPWLGATTALHNTLLQRGIPHQWHVDPGYHESAYWAAHLPEYLKFYGSALTGK